MLKKASMPVPDATRMAHFYFHIFKLVGSVESTEYINMKAREKIRNIVACDLYFIDE